MSWIDKLILVSFPMFGAVIVGIIVGFWIELFRSGWKVRR